MATPRLVISSQRIQIKPAQPCSGSPGGGLLDTWLYYSSSGRFFWLSKGAPALGTPSPHPITRRCLLKLPDTGNQELLQIIHSWNQQVVHRELGNAHKETAPRRSILVLPPEHLQSRALMLKLKESQLPLPSLAQFNSIAVAFSTISTVSYFFPSPLIHLFSTKESWSPKAKQSQENLTTSPHLYVSNC